MSDKLIQLLNQRDQQNTAFETLIQTLQTQLEARKQKDIAFIDPNDPNNDLRRRAQELLKTQPGSLLIYSLVLEDKMWLLVASDGPVLTRDEIDVSQKELADSVIAFRDEMKVYLNDAFTNRRIKTRLEGHDILHLATHGKFEPGDIDKSFLLLGDGNKFPIQQIDMLDALSGVHMVVLSACETALGDRREADGIEIAGISNAFLQRGAKAVVASLWQVNDPATGAYMQRFYENLEQPGMTKVQAMQQVRQGFIDGIVDLDELDSFRASLQAVAGDSAISDGVDLSHPYYWSAFILIGNGL